MFHLALLATAALIPIVVSSHAEARIRHHRAAPARHWTPPEETSIVIDVQTGQVLEQHDADAPHYPASLTKMMTLYLTFEALRQGRITLDTPMTVSAHAASMPPSKLGLPAGHTIALRDAIQVMTTKSANDMAVVVAETLGGTEDNFARMMTAKARQLGMMHTFFYNASGLPNKNHISTARDLAILARDLIRDFPKDYHFFGEKYYVYNGQKIYNTNRLLGHYEGMDGMKTGFTNAAGFNLVASAVRDGHRLIGVVLGGPTPTARNTLMASLLDHGFALDESVGATANRELVAYAARSARPAAPAIAPAPLPMPSAAPSSTASISPPARPTIANKTAWLAPHGLDLTSTAIAAEPTARDVASLKPKAGGWGIQVGAFADINSSRHAVSQATEAVPAILGQARPNVIAVSTGSGALYRARLVGLDKGSARTACDQLSKAGKDCLLVPPAPSRM